MKTVVVLQINHRHGTNLYVAETPELARQLLLAYVKEWWGDGRELPSEMPVDEKEAIDLYFSEAGRPDESYEISDPQEITTKDNLSRHLAGV